jgi:hypothetical protein
LSLIYQCLDNYYQIKIKLLQYYTVQHSKFGMPRIGICPTPLPKLYSYSIDRLGDGNGRRLQLQLQCCICMRTYCTCSSTSATCLPSDPSRHHSLASHHESTTTNSRWVDARSIYVLVHIVLRACLVVKKKSPKKFAQ